MSGLGVSVLGASGYAGTELVGILQGHPHVGAVHTPERDAPASPSDVAFLALPHGESANKALEYTGLGTKVIDLSGDLRFPTAQEYEKWYKMPHPAPELLPVPYGLPEGNKDAIQNADIVAMPGCYPTATLLGILPLVGDGYVVELGSTIVVDAMSGASGAGKKPSEQTHFVELFGNAVPYKIGKEHPHVGEMEQFLGHSVFFSPTLLPIDKGLLTKSTVQLIDGISESDVHEILHAQYQASPFVKVLEAGKVPTIKETANTHGCHIGVVAVEGVAQVVSSLDNLLKGAASQAVQVFNIMHGFSETAGLKGVKS